MAFAKFNICGCCLGGNCHPKTRAKVVNPATGADSPTTVDFKSYLVPGYVDLNPGCTIGTPMWPSGFYLERFSAAQSGSHFISNYHNGDIIDLSATLTAQYANSGSFFVQRDPAASAIFCDTTTEQKCPCYEVSNNNSSAWCMVQWEVYPDAYASGNIADVFGFHSDPYNNCARVFDRCVADLCNGSGVDQHYAVEIPYCLTTINVINATVPANFSNHNLANATSPSIFAVDYCTGVKPPVSVTSCYHTTGTGVQQYLYLPNTSISGCNVYSIPHVGDTYALVDWEAGSFRRGFTGSCTIPPMNGRCDCPTKELLYDCSIQAVNLCGTTTFTPSVIYDSGPVYISNCTQCNVPNKCPVCNKLTDITKIRGAKKPMTASVSIDYESGLGWSGTLYLDNYEWFGNDTWVPNPDLIPCGASPGSNTFNQTIAIPINYPGFAPAFCYTATGQIGCSPTNIVQNFIGCGNYSWNYGSVYATCLDPCFGCHPSVTFGAGTMFPAGDPHNKGSRCFDVSGNDLGTYTADGASCCVTPCGPGCNCCLKSCYMLLPQTPWKTKSCCELAGQYSDYKAHGGCCLTFAQFIASQGGDPACVNDSNPFLTSGSITESSTVDLCNNILVYTQTDAGGNVICILTI